MPDIVIQILKDINVIQLIAIGIMIFFFYNRLDAKMEKQFENVDRQFEKVDKQFEKVDRQFEKVARQIEKLEEKVEDIDRRLCRIEGSLATQGHCLFSQNQHERKVD